MAENDTSEWPDVELLERLDNFSSDSPYEESLVMSARARLRELLVEVTDLERSLEAERESAQYPRP